MKTDFLGHISNEGKLTLTHQQDFLKWLAANPNKSVSISIKTIGKKRSSPQNKFYWGVVVEMIKDGMNAFGNEFTTEQAHEFLKKEFNYKEVETKDGYHIKVPNSTTELSTIEFDEFILKVQKFAAEILDIYIPDPGQQIQAPF